MQQISECFRVNTLLIYKPVFTLSRTQMPIIRFQIYAPFSVSLTSIFTFTFIDNIYTSIRLIQSFFHIKQTDKPTQMKAYPSPFSMVENTVSS